MVYLPSIENDLFRGKAIFEASVMEKMRIKPCSLNHYSLILLLQSRKKKQGESCSNHMLSLC